MRNLVPVHSVSKTVLLLAFVVVISTLLLSCTKNDLDYAKPPVPDRQALFFQVSDHADPVIRTIVHSLHNYNEKNGFIDRLPRNAGLPVWEKLQIKKEPGMLNRGDSIQSFIIPLTENKNNLSSIIIARSLGNDEYVINYHGAAEMNSLCKYPVTDIYKAEQELGLFILMENHTWGTTKFYHIPQTFYPDIKGEVTGTATKSIEITPVPGDNPSLVFIGCWSVRDPDRCNCLQKENCDWKQGCKICTKMICVYIEDPPTPPGPIEPPTGGSGSPTGGGAGGGCASCPTPPPPAPCDEPFYLIDPCAPLPPEMPTEDSLPVRDLLSTYSIAINRKSDSIFEKSMELPQRERGFIIVKKNGVIYAKNFVEGSENAVYHNWFLAPGEILLGAIHTHPDPSLILTDRPAPSGGDITALNTKGHQGIKNYTSFIDCGNVRFAFVIEDPLKANAFFLNVNRSRIDIDDLYEQALSTNPNRSSNYQLAGQQSIISIIGQANNSGIALYISTNTLKTNYNKLN